MLNVFLWVVGERSACVGVQEVTWATVACGYKKCLKTAVHVKSNPIEGYVMLFFSGENNSNTLSD